MTMPGYPVFGTHAKYYGGEVHNLPLLEKNDFLPDLDAIPADVLSRAKVLVHQLSEQPDGRQRHAGVLRAGGRFAKKHNLVVIHDAAYAALVFEGKPLSFLATPGAKDVGVELHSMQQGLQHDRLAAAASSSATRCIVKAYADVKDNTDSGPVPGDPAGRGLRLRSPGDHRADRRQVLAGGWTALVAGAEQGRVQGRASPRARSSSTSRRPKAAVSSDGTPHRVPQRRGRLASG